MKTITKKLTGLALAVMLCVTPMSYGTHEQTEWTNMEITYATGITTALIGVGGMVLAKLIDDCISKETLKKIKLKKENVVEKMAIASGILGCLGLCVGYFASGMVACERHDQEHQEYLKNLPYSEKLRLKLKAWILK